MTAGVEIMLGFRVEGLGVSVQYLGFRVSSAKKTSLEAIFKGLAGFVSNLIWAYPKGITV